MKDRILDCLAWVIVALVMLSAIGIVVWFAVVGREYVVIPVLILVLYFSVWWASERLRKKYESNS
jgi:hypothetical protein